MDLGRGVFRWRGWVSALIFLPACVVAAFSPPWFREAGWLDSACDLAAWSLLAAGIFVRQWATLYIGGRKSASLVTAGPYALCRHPLYVGSFLILLSLPAFLQSLTLAAAAFLLALIYGIAIVPSEEQHALNCFGDDYRAYAQATPRFLPTRLHVDRPGSFEVKIAACLREGGRTCALIVLGGAVDLLTDCRMLPWWPTYFHFP